jgi:hypothetical protein
MFHSSRFVLIVGIVLKFSLSVTLYGQRPEPVIYPDDPIDFKNQFIKRTPPPVHIAKKSGHYTITDWEDVINETWGWGLPRNTKLTVFDTFWNMIDQDFACFVNHPYYYEEWWEDLRHLYRNEIEFGDPTYGVSRGRFAGMMSHLTRLIRETHTGASDNDVTNTSLEPGVPLFHIGAWGIIDHFGAGLTPLPDNSSLVYKVALDHPLGLVPGDIILGYDGIPWNDIYQELLEAQLPITGRNWMTCESAYIHSNLMSAGMNWHLFDTIDILKYETGETINLPTSLMVGHNMELLGSEQMEIPGVPWPDVFAGERVSFGIIDGTQIGYIYVLDWSEIASQEFYEAVNALVNDYETTGLIIDTRLNYGGSIAGSNPAMAILFNTNINHMDWGERCNTSDHLAICPKNNGGQYAIPGNPSSYYDDPIAVLLGPGSNSAGDQMPLRMSYHPMVRFFGKSSSTAFSIRSDFYAGHSQWYASYSPWNTYLVDDPGNYLTRVEFEVDEEVWLTPDDVAQGNDTVVDAAVDWINSMQDTQPDIAYEPAEFDISLEYGDVLVQDLTIYNNGSKAMLYSLTPRIDSRLHPISDKEEDLVHHQSRSKLTTEMSNEYANPIYYDDYLPPDDPKRLPPEIIDNNFLSNKSSESDFVLNHGGPDEFGYVWIDSDQPHGPPSGWIDISDVGTQVTLGDDTYAGPLGIGFDFPFYENDYSELYICSNGYLTFGEPFVDYINDPIPSPDQPNNLVAIWWDDLNPTGREVFYYNDVVNQRFIVSFINIPRYNYGGSLTFQAILYSDGQIDFNYDSMVPGGGYSGGHMLGWGTVGVENIDGTDGLEVIFNRAYMHGGLSIIINKDWICASPYSSNIALGENEVATITFSAKHIIPGTHSGNIYLESNDPDEPSIVIPVSLEVTGGCDYVNVADIVDAYSRLKTGLPEPAYECECPYGSGNEWAVAMDVNNSCAFNVADIVDGYSKLKIGSPELEPCEECPPSSP